MNNAQLNLNSLRQPTPSVVNGQVQQSKQEVAASSPTRTFNLPKVGVVDVPRISTTPIADTLAIEKQENPRMAYKLTPKDNKGFKIQNLFSLVLVGCAIAALLSGKK